MTTVTRFDTREREIIVTGLFKLRGGRSANGRGWVLNELKATELDGTPIAESLRTFNKLEGTERVTFKPYTDDGGALAHWTVERVKTAESIRASRSEARAAVMGEPAPRDTREPDVKTRLAAAEERISDFTRELENALTRIDQLDGRLDLLLSIVQEQAT
jgi:hypothetical protein